MLTVLAALAGLAAGQTCGTDKCPVDTPVQAFDEAQKKQMLMVLRADPTGHNHMDTVDAMVFTTENPKNAYDELVAQADETWEAIDDGHTVHFSYRVTEPVPAQVRIRDDAGLWSAFVMSSYLNIDVPILYAEMQTSSPTSTPTTGHPSTPPTPMPTSTPTISGIEIDGVKYTIHYGKHDIVWDEAWKGNRITVEDGGVTARYFTGSGHQSIRADTCFSEGQHMWRLQLYTNDDERQTNVEWMMTGVVNEGGYQDGHNINGRSCGLRTHGNANECTIGGNQILEGGWKATPAQTTLELLLDCDEGRLTWRFFETEDSFITYRVPQCNDSNQCLYPWLEMHYENRRNQGTILGEPVETFYNEWDESEYPLHYDLVWDEDWMGNRIRCENNCKWAKMYTGNGHQNTRTTEGWDSGKHAWRIQMYAVDDERNTNAQWLVVGTTTDGSYYDSYNQNGRSCGILGHSVTNYCNSWGYVARGNNNRRIPSAQTMILMMDVDEGLLYYQFQGEDEPWVAFHVAKGEKQFPWCQMHNGDRQNTCKLLGQMFEFENVNSHYEQHGNNG